MSREEKTIIDSLVKNLILCLMKDYHLSMLDAMSQFFNSELYDKILDIKSGFYYQSVGHNYQYLRKELETGSMCG